MSEYDSEGPLHYKLSSQINYLFVLHMLLYIFYSIGLFLLDLNWLDFTPFLDWWYCTNKCITVWYTYEKNMFFSIHSDRHLAKELRNGENPCQNSRKSDISLRSGIDSAKWVTDPLYVMVKGLTPKYGSTGNTTLTLIWFGQSQYEIVVDVSFAPL